ncbi:uncharacterized protein LOC108606700 [Drosophila busckii]|uniref:uncharacterized protein LOC108606700 n=1 Tax=Drosophila busckii TaxID=30019 RepID=UPI00083EE2AF|nr:uncharacterized protein LOC108606700 [Drosophila busckii]
MAPIAAKKQYELLPVEHTLHRCLLCLTWRCTFATPKKKKSSTGFESVLKDHPASRLIKKSKDDRKVNKATRVLEAKKIITNSYESCDLYHLAMKREPMVRPKPRSSSEPPKCAPAKATRLGEIQERVDEANLIEMDVEFRQLNI